MKKLTLMACLASCCLFGSAVQASEVAPVPRILVIAVDAIPFDVASQAVSAQAGVGSFAGMRGSYDSDERATRSSAQARRQNRPRERA